MNAYDFIMFDVRRRTINTSNWHPYFRPIRLIDSGFNVLKNRVEKNGFSIFCYPFFSEQSGYFLNKEIFYGAYKPILCVDVINPKDRSPSCVLYDIEADDLSFCKYDLTIERLDRSKYDELISWMVEHIPWKTNPNISLDL